jgi:hypothetical protein
MTKQFQRAEIMLQRQQSGVGADPPAVAKAKVRKWHNSAD